MSDTINNPSDKEIRFLNCNYDEQFRIPDGGYITISHSSGEQLVRKCKYHGERHVGIGRERVYNIREFAEVMARNGSSCLPCPEPEIVQGYMITDRNTVYDKVFVLAHNPDAVQPWVTWQGRTDRSGYDLGHYWANRSDAWTDYFRRADSERTGKPYDHTKLYKKQKNRDAAR